MNNLHALEKLNPILHSLSWQKKNSTFRWLADEFHQIFNEERISTLHNPSSNKEQLAYFYEPSIKLTPKPNVNTTVKANYRSVPLMNTDVNNFNRILVKQVQEYVKSTKYGFTCHFRD